MVFPILGGELLIIEMRFRYMQSWEEFAMQIFGSTEHAYKTMNQAELEAQKGAAVIFPKFVWVAKAA